MIRKYLIISLTIFLCFAYSEGVSIKNTLKAVLTGQFSKLLGKAVQIEDLEGDLLRKIVLKNVSIAKGSSFTEGVDAYAERIEIDYSLKNIILERINILPNIKEIRIYNPYIRVTRNRNGNWNFGKSSETRLEHQAEKPFMGANLRVAIIDGRGLFQDERGWTEKPTGKFESELRNISGEFRLKNEDFEVDLNAIIAGDKNYNNLELRGSVDLITEETQLKVIVENLGLTKWASYVLAESDLNIKAGYADLSLTYKNKMIKNQLQSSFSADLDFHEAVIETQKYLNVPIQNIESKVNISDKGISIKNLKAVLGNNPFEAKGEIANLKNPWLALRLSVIKLPLENIERYVKNLPKTGLQGLVNAELSISGPWKDLQFRAELSSLAVNYQKYQAKDIRLDIAYGKALDINLKKAAIFEGLINAQGKITFDSEKIPNYDLTVEFNNIKAEKIVSFSELAGPGSGQLKLFGLATKLTCSIDIPQLQLDCYQQKINKANLLLEYTKNKIDFKKIKILVNKKELDLAGELAEDKYKFIFNRQNIILQRENLLANYPSITKFNGSIEGYFTGSVRGPGINAEIDLESSDSIILNQHITAGKTKIICKKDLINLKEAFIEANNTKLGFNASYNLKNQDFDLKIDPQTEIALADLDIFQQYFPGGKGKLKLSGECKIQDKKIAAQGLADLANLSYTDLNVDQVQLAFSWQDRLLVLKNYNINLQGNVFNGQGAFYTGAPSKNISWINAVSGNFTLATKEAELATLIRFIQSCAEHQVEFKNKLASFQNTSTENTKIKEIILALNKPIYRELSEKHNLALFKSLASNSNNKKTKKEILPISGKFSGSIGLENKKGLFKMNALFSLKKGRFYNNTFEQLDVDIGTNQNTISSKWKFQNLAVAEKINYDEIVVKTVYNAGLLQINDFIIKYKNEESKNVVRGTFPVAAFWDENYKNAPIDLKFQLAGSDLNLLFSPLAGIQKINNQGEWQFVLQGTYSEPLLSTQKLEFKDTYVVFNNPYYDRLMLKRVDMSITKNILAVNNLELQLAKGEEKTPVLKAFGKIQLKEFTFYKPQWLKMVLDLSVKDIEDNINIPQLYKGDFSLKNFGVNGDLKIPLSLQTWEYHKRTIAENAEAGPVIHGELGLAKGSMYIPKVDPNFSLRGYKRISLFFDLNLFLRNDMRILSGESVILTGDLNVVSQINIGLRDENPVITIKGTSNYPQINGTVYFEDGYISFFYRRFLVLNKREQEKFFNTLQNRAADPFMQFKENNKGEVEPYFFLVAQSTVYEAKESTANIVPTENTAPVLEEKEYLAIVDGPLTDLSAISFEKYSKQNNVYSLTEEPYILKNKNTGELLPPARFQKLATDLAPSLIKSAYKAVTRTGDTEQGTREAAREIVVSQGNLFMRYYLKPVERTIAKETGLYDVRIKRDIGEDAARYFKLTTEEKAFTGEEEAKVHLFGLELVKELAKDRLYFSVDTNIDQNTRYKNLDILINSYKLTWKIFRNFLVDEISLNYGNEYSIYENRYIPLLSLEGLHSF